jgi:hypothetical protein
VIFLVGLSECVLLRLLLWRHRELFFGWNHSGRQCWGVQKSDRVPEHKSQEQCTKVTKREETKNLRKPVSVLKVVNPFTHALAPPLIGRRRTFTFQDYPQIWRIILVWTCSWMYFTSLDLRG